jgi:high affinity sulfate transporter 1
MPSVSGPGPSWLPAVAWLRSYERRQFGADLLAGVTLAAYLLPAAIGDASLARLPPEAGLYACLFSGLLFWLFCGSRHTAISVTSAISLLLGTALGDLAGGDAALFAGLASATALAVAMIAFLAWLARAGTVVSFISESVLVGFKAGVALYLASTQLPKLFGFAGTHGDFFEACVHFARHAHETNAASLALGASALAVLVLGKLFWKNRPVGLLVVVGGIAIASFWDLGAAGVKLLGEVPQGLPLPGAPRAIDWGNPDAVRTVANELLPLALACFLLGAVETAAIGRMFAEKHGGRFDANQEFLALAAANLAAGLGRGYPVSGGMSQSLVNESGGAQTPLSSFISALVILVVVVFLSHLLSALPQPVLAAIVLMAVASLFNVAALRDLWRANRDEFFVAGAALLGVLASGLLRGVLIGAVLSLLLLLRSAARPHVAFLGREPATQIYSDMLQRPQNEPVPGTVIARPEAALYYFNIDQVRDTIIDRVRADSATHMVLDLSAAPIVDLQSARTLRALGTELAALGVQARIVGPHAVVREALRSQGLEQHFGPIHHTITLAEVLAEFRPVGRPNPPL